MMKELELITKDDVDWTPAGVGANGSVIDGEGKYKAGDNTYGEEGDELRGTTYPADDQKDKAMTFKE